ncbi:hypothetical protein EG328_002839 [Venturia inaequalis]|uniref:Uncharacterized protein n=1 Tax=Venturia inaequalis TaxID=5025 RepID=A0A8H3UVG6_VENIN|nr:hypothetical protein EG328_002839 [Venturia inaequalis]
MYLAGEFVARVQESLCELSREGIAKVPDYTGKNMKAVVKSGDSGDPVQNSDREFYLRSKG